jgi:hypothetical protein
MTLSEMHVHERVRTIGFVQKFTTGGRKGYFIITSQDIISSVPFKGYYIA